MEPNHVAVVGEDPEAPLHHRFRSNVGEHILVIPFTRIYDVDAALARRFDALDPDALALAATLALPTASEPELNRVVTPTPQSISLNVSASCNLRCSYCYASSGNFHGAQPAPMNWDVARTAVDALLARADPHAPITIGFLGGEPLVNRPLIRRVVEYASSEAAMHALDVRYAITTNGTLLTADDIELFRSHRFAVTVSVDGGAAVQDRQRPLIGGKSRSSFEALRRTIGPLLADPGLARVAARATVLASDVEVSERFDVILDLGFTEVGFSPARIASSSVASFGAEEWDAYLSALTSIARAEFARAMSGGSIRLTNFAVALKQLHRGAASPYPCGAGGGYFSVAADGAWYACHRAIGQQGYRLGDSGGLSSARRIAFLTSRHVHAQEDCRRCWARYLCSGGCHQEASARTPASCDFVRGWLDFCLAAYCELIAQRPDFFGDLEPHLSEATP